MSDNKAMEKSKRKSVGIQLLGRNESGELVAILQVRAPWNAEKNAPGKWPGACQVTAHGGLEEGEDFFQALLREVKEELGYEFAPIIQELADKEKLVELINLDTPDKHVITYGAVVEQDILKKLTSRQKDRSFGGFKLVKQNEINKIIDLQTFNKETGVAGENTIAMFADEKEAVRLAFEKLSE